MLTSMVCQLGFVPLDRLDCKIGWCGALNSAWPECSKRRYKFVFAKIIDLIHQWRTMPIKAADADITLNILLMAMALCGLGIFGIPEAH